MATCSIARQNGPLSEEIHNSQSDQFQQGASFPGIKRGKLLIFEKKNYKCKVVHLSCRSNIPRNYILISEDFSS